MKRLIAVAALAALTLPGCAQARTRLSGAGATFPSPFYQRTFADYYKETRTKVNYQATGSGAGVRQFFANTLDFGASDKAVKDSHLKEGGRQLVQIPVVGGAIVPAYNKEGCDLKIKQKQLADVYLGKITDWKDLGCSAGKITPIFRSDGSGTTAGFTNSLSSFSPEWKKNVGTAKAVAWPTGIGNKGNAGVAGNIRTTPGSIGYVNQAFIGKIELDDKLRGANGNPDGENSYPIVSLTWILVEPGYKPEAIKPLLRYMLGDSAQKKADSLGYVPLPDQLKQQALDAVEGL